MPTRTNRRLMPTGHDREDPSENILRILSLEKYTEDVRSSSSNAKLFENISITGSFSFDEGNHVWNEEDQPTFESKESIAAVALQQLTKVSKTTPVIISGSNASHINNKTSQHASGNRSVTYHLSTSEV